MRSVDHLATNTWTSAQGNVSLTTGSMRSFLFILHVIYNVMMTRADEL